MLAHRVAESRPAVADVHAPEPRHARRCSCARGCRCTRAPLPATIMLGEPVCSCCVELGERMEDEAAVDLLDVRGVGGFLLYAYDCLLGLQCDDTCRHSPLTFCISSGSRSGTPEYSRPVRFAMRTVVRIRWSEQATARPKAESARRRASPVRRARARVGLRTCARASSSSMSTSSSAITAVICSTRRRPSSPSSANVVSGGLTSPTGCPAAAAKRLRIALVPVGRMPLPRSRGRAS